MNKDIQTKEYLEKLNSIKLSDSSRARMQKNLLDYAQFHAVHDEVRVSETNRSTEQAHQSASLFSFKFIYMPFVILLAVMVGGGTSFAAQGAVPGDLLYPVKTEFNESVRSAFAFSAEAEAELQADLVAERIEEAEELEGEGRLEGVLAAQLAADIREHAGKASRAMNESDAETQVETSTELALSFERFNILVENDAVLAINVSALSPEIAIVTALESEAEPETGTATMLATRKIDPEMLRVSTAARVDNLTTVVLNSEAELSASVYAELTSKLEKAENLMVTSRQQAELASQQSVMQAGELAGEVESKLSLLGTIAIDVNTGAIIDIDFSNVPPAELDRSDESTYIVDVEAEVDSELLQIDTGLNGAATSGLRL